MNKNWLKILVAISAILIAGSAAYFSVTGLGVLFSGAAIAVMVMAGSLEFAKLVTATYLKQEWDNVSGINKWYLTSAVVILMAITSAGIFGYLSNAFQQQNLALQQVQREIDVWENKKKSNISLIEGYKKDKEALQKTQDASVTGGNLKNNTFNRLLANREKQSNKISDKIAKLEELNVIYGDSINVIKTNNISIEREVGGFRFVAEAFGVELNTVVKFFIILIVIVFDPLAVALVISFNQLVALPKRKEDEPTDPSDLKDFVDESSRLHLSENDLKKLEEVLLNPPFPNEALKAAAKRYSDEVREKHTHINDFNVEENKPWKGVSQEVWDRMEAIEKQREAIHGPITEEDVPTGALANSGIRERLEIDEEPYAGPITPYVSDDFIIGPDGAFELTEEIQEQFRADNISDWDSTLMDGLEDEDNDWGGLTNEELIGDDEIISTIEPTIEEENENFSTIEPNQENIFQEEDGWTEELEEQYWNEQVPEPFATEVELENVSEQSIQEEVEEMISQALSIPPMEENPVYVEMPSDDSEIESEKKKS